MKDVQIISVAKTQFSLTQNAHFSFRSHFTILLCNDDTLNVSLEYRHQHRKREKYDFFKGFYVHDHKPPTQGWDCKTFKQHLQNVTLICVMVKTTHDIQNYTEGHRMILYALDL